MPAARTPAQIEASRRNGARSKGPVTPEGKAKASRNALEDEVPDDLEELIAHLADEVGATSEIEARLARRLAIAFWKSERAERIEVALFDAAPRIRPPHGGFQWEEADPLTTFDVRRFNAIRAQQAQLGREIRNCLKELRLLRKDALTRTDEPDAALEIEPESMPRNEPKARPPANDDVAAAPGKPAVAVAAPLRNEPDQPGEALRNEPGERPSETPWLVEGVPVLDVWGRPRMRPAAVAS